MSAGSSAGVAEENMASLEDALRMAIANNPEVLGRLGLVYAADTGAMSTLVSDSGPPTPVHGTETCPDQSLSQELSDHMDGLERGEASASH